MPAGFKTRGIRVRDDAQPLQPGEFREVDAPGGNIRDSFMQLPYKEPSQTLLQLMGVVVQAGQRFASIADSQVGDMNQQAAVGTTVALLERIFHPFILTMFLTREKKLKFQTLTTG